MQSVSTRRLHRADARVTPRAPAKALSGRRPRVYYPGCIPWVIWLPCRLTAKRSQALLHLRTTIVEALCHLGGGQQALTLTSCATRADHWRAWHDVDRNLDALADHMHPSRCAHACSRSGSSPGPSHVPCLPVMRHAPWVCTSPHCLPQKAQRCSTHIYPCSHNAPACKRAHGARRFVEPLGWVPPAPPPPPPRASACARCQVLRAPPELRAVVGNAEVLHCLLCSLPGVEPWAPCVVVRRRPRTRPSSSYDVLNVGSASSHSQGSLAF